MAKKVNKRESELKSELLQAIKKYLHGFVALRHEDVRNGGIPDLSVTAISMTSWWEIKHATPRFTSPELQRITCLRLAQGGYCRYIIYWEHMGNLETQIIHPVHISDRPIIEAAADGHNHKFVTDFMRMVHFSPAVNPRRMRN